MPKKDSRGRENGVEFCHIIPNGFWLTMETTSLPGGVMLWVGVILAFLETLYWHTSISKSHVFVVGIHKSVRKEAYEIRTCVVILVEDNNRGAFF